MENQIKLVISDLDGTLLNSEHRLSDKTIQTVRQLKAKGIDFWIATGRHHCDARNFKKELGIDARLITANGATVSDETGTLIKEYAFPKEILPKLIAVPMPEGVYRSMYQGEYWLTEEIDVIFKDYLIEGGFTYTICNFSDHIHLPINKFFYTSMETDRLEAVADFISTEFGDLVDVTFSTPRCMEVMPKGTNKGSAILDLLKEVGLDPSEVIAFGDGMNDLEMLGVVGLGHIPENASDKLKAALPQCKPIGHHAQDSVAEVLTAYFNLS